MGILKGGSLRKNPSSLIEEGTLLAKSNLLKSGVVQVVPTGWQVGDMTRPGGNGRDEAAPMIVQGRLRIRQSSSQIFEQEKLVKPDDPASGPWKTLSSASVQQDNSIP